MANGEEKGRNRPLVRDYTFLALGALALCGMVLYFDGPGIWGLLPVLLGMIGVLVRWGAAPALYLVTLLVVLILPDRLLWLLGAPSGHRGEVELTDVVLAAASLIYVAAQMRLQSLVRHGVPPDLRRKRRLLSPRLVGRWFLPGQPTHRSGAAGGGELLLLLIAAPGFALVAWLLWMRLALEPSPEPGSLPPVLWQIVVIVWAMVIGLAGMHAFLGYLGRARASPEESTVFLQDQLWGATRGEQRRINRWLVWARLRRQRKEEKP
jgi:hypothetical protein